MRPSRQCFGEAIEAAIESRRRSEEGQCRRICGCELRYKGDCSRTQVALVRRGRWGRGYYHSARRGRRRYPLDQALGVGRGVFSEGVQEGAARLGIEMPFSKAAEQYAVIASLVALAEQPQGAAAQEHIHYFEVNEERMRYPPYRAHVYPTGGGVVGSACQRAVGARLKYPATCWSQVGAQSPLALRTAQLSSRWDRTWRDTAPLSLAA